MSITADMASAELCVLYTEVLGRQPDAAAVAALIPALASGLDPNVLRAQLALGSGEATADIDSLYRATLGRAPDSAGSTAFLTLLANGSLSLEGIRAALATTPEAAAAISLLYQQVLGRAADPAGNTQFAAALASGFSLSDVRQQLVASPEAANTLNSLYQTVLNRPVDAGGLRSFTALLQSGASLNDVRLSLAASPEAKALLTRTYVGDGAEFQARLSQAYELNFGSTPAASTLAAQETELALGRSFADTAQASVLTIGGSGGLIKNYGYEIPQQYAASGSSQFISIFNTSYLLYQGSISTVITPITGVSAFLPGSDTIVLNLQTVKGAPLSFIATLDGQPLGGAILSAAEPTAPNTVSTQDQVTFTGAFGLNLHQLHVQVTSDASTNALYIAPGATFDGNTFLFGGVATNPAGAVDIFPHAGPQPMLQHGN